MADSNLHGSYTYSDTLKGIYYGPACVHTALPRLLSVLGGSKAFVITGKSLREKVYHDELHSSSSSALTYTLSARQM
jgi:hypothetical protein